MATVSLLSRATAKVSVSVLRSNVLRLEARFEKASLFVDPNSVTLKLKKPDGSELSPAPVPTRIEAGLYRYDFDTQGMASGIWAFRWEGDGGVDAAVEGTFEVTSGQF